ncbi:MAG: hypothetical protein WCJ30_06895 [Deltaproteobacteria bacterium]
MTNVNLHAANGPAASAAIFATEHRRGLGALACGPDAPMPPVDLPGGDTATPLETIDALRGLEAEFSSALSSGDPTTMMAALAMRVRKQSTGAMTAEAAATGTARTVHLAAQMEAYHKAERSQADAATWGLVAKVGGYIAAAVSVAVGIVASVVSGGTSLAGGIALAVLCVSATASVSLMAATDLHAFGNEPPPKWLTISVAVLALVGAVCSGGAGAGGVVGAIGSGLSVTAQTVSVVTDIGVETHAFPEPPAWFRLTLAGCSLAGAAATGLGSMTSAGNAASSVATSASAAVRSASEAAVATVGAVSRGAQALTLVTRAAAQVGSAVCTFMADGETARAQSHGRSITRLHDEAGDVVDALRHVNAVYRRSIERSSEAARDENNHRDAIVRNFARA